MPSIVYGPVPSWRLGRSLGIDMLSTAGNTCSFDCIYCQLGSTSHPLTERRLFVTTHDLEMALNDARGIPADYATFSGMGEPTLASNLGEAIQMARSILQLPTAVLTNASLMPESDVCRELALADVVVAKVDAPSNDLFHRINRPFGDAALQDILDGIRRFRSAYGGNLALQMMFIETNKDCAEQMAQIAADISPDEIQINTPLRPCAVGPLSPEEIAAIRQHFAGLPGVVTVYERVGPDVTPIDKQEVMRRRPER